MATILNTHEALKILNEHYITDSLQMVVRWIGEGRILAERSDYRKGGWRIKADDLYDFIEAVHPGLVLKNEKYNECMGIKPIPSLEKQIVNVAAVGYQSNQKSDVTREDSTEEQIRLHEAKLNHLGKQIQNINDSLQSLHDSDKIMKKIEETVEKQLTHKLEQVSEQIQQVKNLLNGELPGASKTSTAEAKKLSNDKLPLNKGQESDSSPDDKINKKIQKLKEKTFNRKDFHGTVKGKISDEEFILHEGDINRYYDTLFTEENKINHDYITKDGTVKAPFNLGYVHSYVVALVKESIKDYIQLCKTQGVDNNPSTE
ncbi:MAG: hypothetical protein ACI35O_04365 [Bacillaceae bacterium]